GFVSLNTLSLSGVVCPAPQIQNGRVAVPKPRYTYRDSVTFKCHRGFTLRGHPTSQCQGDRRWHPPLPVCEQGKNQLLALLGLHI
ncbi:CR2 protein, partial [Prunella himalayana]|nr:CR2 protein [Prunella himalayana]